jgi:hypothetical protein
MFLPQRPEWFVLLEKGVDGPVKPGHDGAGTVRA